MNKKEELMLKTQIDILSKKVQILKDSKEQNEDIFNEVENILILVEIVSENVNTKNQLNHLKSQYERDLKNHSVKLEYLCEEKKSLEKQLSKYKKNFNRLEFMTSQIFPNSNLKKSVSLESNEIYRIEEIENELQNLYKVFEEKEYENKELKRIIDQSNFGKNDKNVLEENIRLRKQILNVNDLLRNQEHRIEELQWENKQIERDSRYKTMCQNCENQENLQPNSKSTLVSYKDSNEISTLKKSLKEAIEKCAHHIMNEKELQKQLDSKEEQIRSSKYNTSVMKKTLNGQICYLTGNNESTKSEFKDIKIQNKQLLAENDSLKALVMRLESRLQSITKTMKME